MLDPLQCRARQHRLLQVMHRRRLDAVVVGSRQHVYYLTAHLCDWKQQSGAILFADGTCWLASANNPDADAAADETLAYDANRFGTLTMDQARQVAALAAERLRRAQQKQRVGIDASPVSSQVLIGLDAAEFERIDDDLIQMRRIKDDDELELMKRAIQCTQAMYARAREIIEPGVGELRVFGELHAAAVESAGEMLSAPLGNDFACGQRAGHARAGKTARAGETYILDLGPAYRGYFADNARAFAVDRRPTDAQLQAWRTIVHCHDMVQQMCKPGVRCREVFEAVNQYLRDRTGGGIEHHLGHGVGLYPHEFPHLNPEWDDVLQQGEVISIEPALYGDHLGGGIRIENQYLITQSGAWNLTPFPLELI